MSVWRLCCAEMAACRLLRMSSTCLGSELPLGMLAVGAAGPDERIWSLSSSSELCGCSCLAQHQTISRETVMEAVCYLFLIPSGST